MKKEATLPQSKAEKALNPKQRAFVLEYLIDLNATAAAVRAGYKAPNTQGPRLLVNVGIADAIQEAMAERAKRVQVTTDDVLRHWVAIADADPRELIELRRTCCRYSHGKKFQYQRTKGEMAHARAEWELLTEKANVTGSPAPSPFDTQGGGGYDARKRPHPACPECFGEGMTVVIPRTRASCRTARGDCSPA